MDGSVNELGDVITALIVITTMLVTFSATLVQILV